MSDFNELIANPEKIEQQIAVHEGELRKLKSLLRTAKMMKSPDAPKKRARKKEETPAA